MGIAAKCDIRGCDVTADLDDLDNLALNLPVGWSRVETSIYPLQREAQALAAAFAPMAGISDVAAIMQDAMVQGMALNAVSSGNVRLQARIVCPKHPMPEWKEPVATGKLPNPAQPELPGIDAMDCGIPRPR